MYSTRASIIWKQLENNAETKISEEELFKYTRHRWLTLEEDQVLRSRYRKFNVSALIEAAVAAVGDSAKSCLKILKCLEGSYNKSLLLTMDNGVDVVVKLPNPNAGPAFFTTASQVATQRFVREVLNVPCPRVLAYSAEANNAVGAEYIIEEKATGRPLSNFWYTSSREVQARFISRLVELEDKMTSVSFRSHGGLYYKKDLTQRGISVRDLQAPLLHPSSQRCHHPLLKTYGIGPIPTAALWANERAIMDDLNRGPWISPRDYMTSIGIDERSWAQSFAVPRIDPYRLSDQAQAPADYISLLDKYLGLVDCMSPAPIPATLSHPDLHLDNIFVDPDTMEIVSIVDWQSTTISEPYFHHGCPPMLSPIAPFTRLNDYNGESVAEGDPELNNLLTRLPYLNDYYHALKRKNCSQQCDAMNDANRHFLTKVVPSVTGSWTRDNGFRLTHRLIAMATDWQNITSQELPPSLRFTEEELSHHRRDLEAVAELAQILEELEGASIIPNGGKVRADDFDRALDASRSVKDWFVDKGTSKEERELNAKIWPYQF